MTDWAATKYRVWRTLRSVFARERGGPSRGDLANILAHWNITRFTVSQQPRAGSGSTWLIDTPRGKHILRNAGTDRPYMEFQVFVMVALAEAGFPYRTPRLMSAEGGHWHLYQEHYWMISRLSQAIRWG